VLSTISKKRDGWPFGSVAPYALDSRGAPLILIASIAEHTKNLVADDRVSLLVHDGDRGGDVQAQGRVTVLGRARPLEAAEIRDAQGRYAARVPGSVDYFATHDFRFFRIEPAWVRFIGGFGEIHWLDAEAITLDPQTDPIRPIAAGVVEHMNLDHADALALICRAFGGCSPERAELVGVDAYGLDIECHNPDRRVRAEFEQPATAATIRETVVGLVKQARAR
jgi:hypothetical protein